MTDQCQAAVKWSWRGAQMHRQCGHMATTERLNWQLKDREEPQNRRPNRRTWVAIKVCDKHMKAKRLWPYWENISW
jgi:hypothetical protein